MARSLNIWVAVGLALAITAPGAKAAVRHVRHHHHIAPPVVEPGDIVVHARPSYLTGGPGGWVDVGTANTYVTDAMPASPDALGSSFGGFMGSVLPSRFNPPGRPQPLFEFSEP